MTEQDKRDRLLSVVARSSVSTDVQVEALDYVRDLEGRVKALEGLLWKTVRWLDQSFGNPFPDGCTDPDLQEEECVSCQAFNLYDRMDALLAGGAADES